ncbi:hypothetical protein KVR01_010966 [Diaporthe batatas]|uniref:uncharacterized protein n=1 Tax=Diaporthe batatas TaxID=748121 RepID=UPI001D058B9B|nr:uncharacterized protein KVR01_010966 [Diaporthe batatas]KAG8159305.1 hypothetical protein KVR01_010966 [Diaporthe batatas]
MFLSSLSLGLVVSHLLSSTTAFGVTTDSPCASACLDSADVDFVRTAASAINSSDIVCNDVDYFSSANGQKFKNCITCLQTSDTSSGDESDVAWFLYNLRFASAVCLYDYPSHNTTTTTPCDLNSACAPLQGALEYGSLRPENATGYGYCQADGGVLEGANLDDCVTCLQSSSSTYLANCELLFVAVLHAEHQADPAPVLLALEAGCREQPPPGTALGISGNIFSAFPINSTSSTAAGSDGEDKPVITTGAIVGIALGAAALFLGAIALFVVYCLKQKKYEREDRALPHPYGQAQHFYYKDPGSGPASITTDHSYVLPQYTVDYKPSVSETPEPLPSDYSSNAEYYDRLEGKTRGRPLVTISPPAQQPQPQPQPQPAASHEQVDTIGQLPTTSLPTHPAYIPRTSSRNSNSRTTPPPGARPSRNPTPASVRSSTQTSSSQPPHHNTTNGSGGAKPDSYAIQVYLNAAEDPKVPQPPPPVAAPSWSSSYPVPGRATPASNAEIARNIQVELAGARATPPVSAASMPQGGVGGRATPAPSLQHISRTTSPDHTAASLGDGSPLPPPPRIGSLILPSVPRIRVPGSRKLPPRLEVPDDVGTGAGAGISGPLAFPGSRFSTRPPAPGAVFGPARGQDRIIEQMVDRGGRSVEVPIGSGKSYLYG